ncbi:MAG: T9SS type A sorting domain-containing protein [Lewinellaceae bacterium]|nr:T9SS type A sorting domain-containing protein [Lewinellaceae bacterium]
MPEALPEDAQLTLFDAAGRQVARRIVSFANSPPVVDVSALQAGLYCIRIQYEAEIFQQKIHIIRP